MEKTIQDLAQEVSKLFVTGKRNDDSEFISCPNRPDWLGNLIFKAHDDMLPDDWKYQFVSDAIDYIAEQENDDDLDCPNLEPSIYYSDLTGWLHSNATRIGYLDEAFSQFGGYTTGNALLMDAQRIEREEVYWIILQGLRDQLEEENQDIEEEEEEE